MNIKEENKGKMMKIYAFLYLKPYTKIAWNF